MDTLTHALSGALLGRATTTNSNQQTLSLKARIIAGTLAAAFPDIDFVARFFGIINYLETHRGITHSFVLLPLWALLLAYIFSKFSNGRYQWRDFYLVAASGLTIHILGDVITAYGTMMFAPITYAKFAWPTTFIIDFYFTGIIVTALILASIFKSKGKIIALSGIVILVSYIGFQATLHQEAEDIANNYVNDNDIKMAKVYVMPQAFSPFHWKAIIKSSETYYVSYMNLRSKKFLELNNKAGFFEKIRSVYQPVQYLQWTPIEKYGTKETDLSKKVWFMDLMSSVRDFMLFPVVSSVIKTQDKICIWFKDHRFVISNVRDGPFRFGACKSKNTLWQLYHLSDDIPVLLTK